ncbi:MAG TPA: hypothetical protein VK923_17700, partial [Euzebyales bacterium]|nr:hypothetical protein [Euzebyales bacterium]
MLSAAGLELAVFGILQASTWGGLLPKNSPVEVFGFALTPLRRGGRYRGPRGVRGLTMSILGIGMGLVASQLGNIIQSAVGPAQRQRGGWTPVDRTAARVVAGCGVDRRIVLTGLSATFVNQVAGDERISADVA